MTAPQTPAFIQASDVADRMDWASAVAALRAGHQCPKAQVADVFLGPTQGSLLSRAAHIEGLGFGVKSVTVFGQNPQAGWPTVQGAMQVFEPEHGRLVAIIDSRLITEWKTAADSLLGAQLLARADSETLLIVGAGTVARSLVRAYPAMFSSIRRILVWARRADQAQALVDEAVASEWAPAVKLAVASDLRTAAMQADIISTATMAREPVLRGDMVRPGTHVDLIGAFKADMREADDALMQSGCLFVDSRETTLHHIGELLMPIAAGAITPEDVMGDLYDLVGERCGARLLSEDITVFKNGGGAHLDLMMATYIASLCDVT